jgi:hypothetical protein
VKNQKVITFHGKTPKKPWRYSGRRVPLEKSAFAVGQLKR